jgi:hypothetical protein
MSGLQLKECPEVSPKSTSNRRTEEGNEKIVTEKRKTKGRDNTENVGVNSMIILKWMLNKYK